MIKLVNDFASRNECFAKAVKEIETAYGKNLTSEEVFADVCGQLFGNQEFINTLETQNTEQAKSLIRQIYEAIKKLLDRLTAEGRYRNFVQNLEIKWRNAYRNTTMQQAINNLNNEVKYAQKVLKDGTYVAYAKRNLVNNASLLKSIKKEMSRSKSSLASFSYNKTLSQNNNKVKSSTKYSMLLKLQFSQGTEK